MVCLAQLGRFEKRRADLEKKGAALAAICIDPIEKSQAVAKKLDLHYPILADTTGETIRAFGVAHAGKPFALPAVFVVAPDGRIAWRRIGETVGDRPSEDDVLAAIPVAR